MEKYTEKQIYIIEKSTLYNELNMNDFNVLPYIEYVYEVDIPDDDNIILSIKHNTFMIQTNTFIVKSKQKIYDDFILLSYFNNDFTFYNSINMSLHCYYPSKNITHYFQSEQLDTRISKLIDLFFNTGFHLLKADLHNILECFIIMLSSESNCRDKKCYNKCLSNKKSSNNMYEYSRNIRFELTIFYECIITTIIGKKHKAIVNISIDCLKKLATVILEYLTIYKHIDKDKIDKLYKIVND